MTEIRHITEAEYCGARRVWNVCFPEDAGEYADYYFAKRTSYKNVIAAFDGMQMAGCLHIIPHRIRVCGESLPVGLIAGVGTLPEYRGQGIAKELLAVAKAELTARGAYGAMLQPVNTAYYLSSGFEPYCVKGTFELKGGEGRLESASSAAELLEIYREYARGFDGMRERSEADMELLMEEWRITGCRIAVAGNAYAVYYVKDGMAHTVEAAGEDIDTVLREIQGENGVRAELLLTAVTSGEKVKERVFTMMAHLGQKCEKKPVCSLEYC